LSGKKAEKSLWRKRQKAGKKRFKPRLFWPPLPPPSQWRWRTCPTPPPPPQMKGVSEETWIASSFSRAVQRDREGEEGNCSHLFARAVEKKVELEWNFRCGQICSCAKFMSRQSESHREEQGGEKEEEVEKTCQTSGKTSADGRNA
jgi:hypothetical protein